MALGRTAKYYRDNPEARKKDVSHKSNGRVSLRPQSKNRGDKNDTAGDKRARGKKKKK